MSEAAQAVETAPVEDEGTIFDGVETTPVETPTENVVDTPSNPDVRPDWLPEKFKTPEDLVKSYNEMGTKIREKFEPPETYEITMPEGVESNLGEADVAAFKEAGLTNEQAQKLTEYFYQAIVPELQDARAGLEKERLADAWQLRPDSHEFAQQLTQIKSWADNNLPESVVVELSRSARGVQTIHTLMENSAQSHRAVGAPQSRPTRDQLNQLMQDERYWKGDEEYRKYVNEQYRAAYD